MWNLIVNGLGLVGTGYSFLSAFSLDKKIGAINSSLERLETLQSQFNDRVTSHSLLADTFAPLMGAFSQKSDPAEQIRIAQSLAEQSMRWRTDLERSTSTLLANAISEMHGIIDSVRFNQTSQQRAPERLTRALYNDPFDAGVVEYRDISQTGIWGVDEPYIISPHLSPISWQHPRSGRRFLGKISLADLQRYGIKMDAPRYRHSTDGQVYSDSHGLYLPSYLL